MRPQLAPEAQMTVEEFLAFADSRPQEERWELIEGRIVMSPSPTDWHQIITGNIYAGLARCRIATASTWTPMLGIGTQVPVSPNSLPTPDVLVREHAPGAAARAVTDDALVLVEVLSRSNTKADQSWRRRVYASVPNCQHYVAVSQTSLSVTRYDRADGWKGMTMEGAAEVLALPALGPEAVIPLAEIYQFTPLAP